LGRGLVQLDAAGSAGLEELMRAAHSIKGAAKIVGLEAVARVAHAMEDCFVAAQQQRLVLREHHIDALLAAVDLLSEVAALPIGGVPAWQAHHASTASQFAERLETLASDGELPSPALSKPLPVAIAPLSSAPEAPVAALSLDPHKDLQARPQRGVLRPSVAAPDRVVRVAAQSINRLMGLAGESLIESRRIHGLSGAMQRIKRRQAGIADIFDALVREVATQPNVRIQSLLAEAKERSVESHAAIVEQIGELDDYAQRVDDLSHRLYREALKSRMRPFGDCVHGFPRLVRDVARELGKIVKLNIVGESTDVDRDVLESLDAPLNHLLRNSLDHGIEGPDERSAGGKAVHGTVRLEARHQAGMLAITVSDDGRGIDPERLRKKVVERGLVTGPMAAALSSAELLEFIFLPGFSTAQDVTHISGRGVGLDAVRTAVQAVSGTVHVISTIGTGTSFHLRLPVTRSVMRAVVVEVAGEGYAFPLLGIERVLRVDRRDVRHVGNAQYFVLEGANIALVSAEQVLGFEKEPRPVGELCVVIIGDGTHRYGITVGKFLGEHDLVVRPLDARLGKVQDIAAAAIQRDGSPALIFDVNDLLRSIEKLAQAGRVDELSGSLTAGVTLHRKRVLVVDDSITVREAERQLLVNHGYDVDVAVDGMDGWSSVRNSHYDLVVSDIDMPRMNGLEMIRTIKQDPRLRSIPIVIVSYKDREEDRIRGLDAGANHYLTKSSFHDEALVHAVQNLIGAAT
jgi:two-component system sensor histidine kinase and response regulator WspE